MYIENEVYFSEDNNMHISFPLFSSLNIFKSSKLMVNLLTIVIAVTLKESHNLENAEEESIAKRKLVQDRQTQHQVHRTQVPHHPPHLRNLHHRRRHHQAQMIHPMRIAKKKIQKKQYLQQL